MILLADNRYYVGLDGAGPAVTCQGCLSTGLSLYLNSTPYGLVAVCEGCYDYLEYMHSLNFANNWRLHTIWN